MEIAKVIALKTADAASVTPLQRQMFDFVAETIANSGLPPTYEQMADHFGIVRSGAYRIVEALVTAGYLQKQKRGSKTIIALGGN
jgi:SOS-response transcriptional repressor LexA